MKESEEILLLDDIHYQIDDQVILDSVSFGLKQGEFKLITGPSGCGKSTLLKIVSSLIDPTRGKIIFDGKPITAMSPEAYRQQVSYCFQTPALFGDTVYDNIALPYLIRKQKPDEQKMKADLARFGLAENKLKKSVNELSGGEKQRISLIRNLQFMPKVLLLDEITSALDEENKRNVNEIIHQLVSQHGVAALWVTHDKDEIKHADDVITLSAHGARAQEKADEPA
ncbi:iron efflux ABC transporter ATP-binding subunit FetA [Serratia plymuthica]|uniref:Putrescine/spermidine ABC transporter ATP-binding protein n=1 Tax=Serratia plymuthica S13 TaxID=1348660 RepID=S4YQ20_SERPL|nr:iron ABC transporter ATP-binding protein FetA [Serratia plymuthica]AGP47407.1 putrescine/spermidine ABC transporter ATP-binding protein [Serratia plymuthica S13]ANJ93698.1 ABC transporter ATP-binding protein [Serratia plymuthica]ANK00872.1 ABC transporter ATP-binding protein [Serratia plymuthica]EKF61944.1 putative ABC-type sugar/spermidine/putrescine transport system, ATPase component [Serratia plymuthica A30]KYG17234.1 putative ABC transporter ATP-binding protein YbbL [Serratia plymuthica